MIVKDDITETVNYFQKKHQEQITYQFQLKKFEILLL